jgi:hypothetical protein
MVGHGNPPTDQTEEEIARVAKTKIAEQKDWQGTQTTQLRRNTHHHEIGVTTPWTQLMKLGMALLALIKLQIHAPTHRVNV